MKMAQSIRRVMRPRVVTGVVAVGSFLFNSSAGAGEPRFGVIVGAAPPLPAAEVLQLGGTLIVNRGCASGPQYGCDARMHVGAGVLAEPPVGGRFALRLAPRYLPKERHQVLDSAGTLLPVDYLELPVQLKATLQSGTPRPYVVAGPSAAVRLHSDPRLTRAWRPFDLGLAFGGGVQFDYESGSSVLLDVQYARGLIPVDRSAPGNPSTEKTRGVHVSVTIAKRVGGRKAP
jgi:hypothetical protein